MPAYKDKKTGLFYVQFYYRDARGARRHKTKKGFQTELEALLWEKNFKALKDDAMDMTFADFCNVYEAEVRPRVREHTWLTKENIIQSKLIPFFGDMRMCDIRPVDIVRWQNSLTGSTRPDGDGFKPTYLRIINNQLNAIFNHASRYYGLNPNPAVKTMKIGAREAREMSFWTKEEYLKFSEAMMEKPRSFIMFEILYWTGIRVGELLALVPESFDLVSMEMRITSSYQRLDGQDLITDPKTPKSVRTIKIPEFLNEEIREYLDSRQDVRNGERVFKVTKHYLAHEMKRGCAATGVKRIRIHDLRHSHVSLLIDMGFSALAIADRLGQEAIDVTFRYAHLFPSVQEDMATALNESRGDDL